MKDLFRTLRRLHFWIICPLIVLMGLVGWWMATGAIQKVTQSRVGAIKGQFRDLQTIAGKSPHPNADVEEGMNRLIEARRDEVAEAWTEKYNQQDKGNVMTWDFDETKWPTGDVPRFVRVVEGLRPIEKMVPFPTEHEPLIVTLRTTYRDYIATELPKLARTIRAQWNPSSGGRLGPSRPMFDEDGPGFSPTPEGDDEQEVQTIVEWSPENQQEILETHFTWNEQRGLGPMAFQEGGSVSSTTLAQRPTTLDVLYAQEDFWVLQAIMNVIDKTNVDPNDPTKPVTTSVNATVKAIDYIRIGANASQPQGRIQKSAGAVAGDPEGTRGGFQGGPPPEMMMGGEPGMMMEGGDPAEGRYVDKNYQALPAETLRSVMSTEGAVDPESVYLVVAKRMPVRMGLKVDQRRLNQLLQECASSDLTIEIRQIRINQADASAQGFGVPQFSGQRGAQRGRSEMEQDAFSFDIDVELYGIIYIYNPVDRSVLGYEDAAVGEAEGDLTAL